MAHFDEGLALCRKAGNQPVLAWTLCDYADLLREHPTTGSAQAGDSEQAGALYGESLQIATEIGMRPLMERVLSRKDILKA